MLYDIPMDLHIYLTCMIITDGPSEPNITVSERGKYFCMLLTLRLLCACAFFVFFFTRPLTSRVFPDLATVCGFLVVSRPFLSTSSNRIDNLSQSERMQVIVKLSDSVELLYRAYHTIHLTNII